jgi:hypothetical protein
MRQTTKVRKLGTAEAFYNIFCALPKKERLAIVRYILRDKEIQKKFKLAEIPNAITLKAFAEDKKKIPVFETIDDLRKDLLS